MYDGASVKGMFVETVARYRKIECTHHIFNGHFTNVI
jgi:hypothetical protein